MGLEKEHFCFLQQVKTNFFFVLLIRILQLSQLQKQAYLQSTKQVKISETSSKHFQTEQLSQIFSPKISKKYLS
jgi:hypothetical protein